MIRAANPFAQSPAGAIQLYERVKFAEKFLARTQPDSRALVLIRRTIARDAVDAIFKGLK
jgi:hypothetical protein